MSPGRVGAGARDGDGGGAGGVGQGGGQGRLVQSVEAGECLGPVQGVEDAGVEGVAGADGVGDLDPERGGGQAVVARVGDGAVGAAGLQD